MQVCFQEQNLIIILVLILSLLFVSFIFYKQENVAQPKVYTLSNQPQNQLQNQPQNQLQNQLQNNYLDKIYNPLHPPENKYDIGYNYQQLGFVFLDNERYPLFGRNKYPNKSDKKEYYILDESKNRLKIPFATPSNNELYDGDKVFINLLNREFNVKIYDNEEIRYNPNI